MLEQTKSMNIILDLLLIQWFLRAFLKNLLYFKSVE